MNYDDWKMTEPYDPSLDTDDPLVRCDHCEEWMEDGAGNRLGADFICAACYYAHPAVCGPIMAALKADIKRDDR